VTKNGFLRDVIFKICELAVLSNERFGPVDISFPDLWHQVIRGLSDSTNRTPPEHYTFSESFIEFLAVSETKCRMDLSPKLLDFVC
jgi:hypothetical protein